MKWFAAALWSGIGIVILANVFAAITAPPKMDPSPVLATHKFVMCKFPKIAYPLSKTDQAALLPSALTQGFFETPDHRSRFKNTVLPKAPQLFTLMAQATAVQPKGSVCVNLQDEAFSKDAGSATLTTRWVASFLASYAIYEWETHGGVPADKLKVARDWFMATSRRGETGLAIAVATRGMLMAYVAHRDARFKRVVDTLFPKVLWFEQVADAATYEALDFNGMLDKAPVPFRNTPLKNLIFRVTTVQTHVWQENADFIASYKTRPCPTQEPNAGLAWWEYLDWNLINKWSLRYFKNRLDNLHAFSCNAILHERMVSKTTGYYESINYKAMPIPKK